MINSGYDYVFKFVLIGNSSVGKTSLLRRVIDKDFDETQAKSTIGVEFKIISFGLTSGKVAKLQIWDTAGQERYRAITAAYYRGAQAILIVFDLTNRKSFDDLEEWVAEIAHFHPHINNMYHQSDHVGAIFYLFGIKADLEGRCVGEEEINEFVEKYGMQYSEVSAKLGTNVYDAFFNMAELCEDKYNALVTTGEQKECDALSSSNNVTLTPSEDFFDINKVDDDKCTC